MEAGGPAKGERYHCIQRFMARYLRPLYSTNAALYRRHRSRPHQTLTPVGRKGATWPAMVVPAWAKDHGSGLRTTDGTKQSIPRVGVRQSRRGGQAGREIA